MSTSVKTESNLRRIQDFMANYELNYEQIALLLCCRFGDPISADQRPNHLGD